MTATDTTTRPEADPHKIIKDAIKAIRDNADLIERLVSVVGVGNPGCVDLTEDASAECDAIRDALIELGDIRRDFLGCRRLTPSQVRRVHTD